MNLYRIKQLLEYYLPENNPALLEINILLKQEEKEIKYFYYFTRDNKNIGIQVTNNEGDCCGDHTYELVENYTTSETKWVTEDLLHIIYVKYNNTPWYNSNLDSPVNNFQPAELTIIRSDGKIINTRPIKYLLYNRLYKYLYPRENIYKENKQIYNGSWEALNYLYRQVKQVAQVKRKEKADEILQPREEKSKIN